MTESSAPNENNAVEESAAFSPRFDASGLITAVVTDVNNGELLMVAHMNEQSLQLTLESGIAHYWSRSRRQLWKKGETSGNLQHVKELRVDCDQDALWLKVDVAGASVTCHTGRRSCFYRKIEALNGAVSLKMDDISPRFEPSPVYP